MTAPPPCSPHGSPHWSPHCSKDRHALLADMLDVLIPARADGRIPAAGRLGVADWLRQRAGDDPALAAALAALLDRAASLAPPDGLASRDAAGREAILTRLEAECGAAFALLVRHTYMGYYSRGDVRRCLGLSPRPTQPDGHAQPADDPDALAALVAPVRRRGPCFRPG